LLDLVIHFLAQIGGGPGPAENNLVRFALPALFWGVLFIVAWSRRRSDPQPREQLLLFGFGLFFAREFFMFLHTFERMVLGPQSPTQRSYIEPLEHALAVSAVLVISAAFLRYILDEPTLPRRYLLLGLSAVGTGVVISFILWPAQQAANPGQPFHSTIGAVLMHGIKAVFILAAIFLLVKNKGWVSNVVILALSFLLISVLLTFVNTFTGRAYASVICPISNNFHIWAVPIFGFVYFREQSIAKREAESKLATYRGHLEQLVDRRTAELAAANEKLKLEVAERTRAQAVVTSRNAELSTQNLIAATISRSLDLEELLHAALNQSIHLLEMDKGCIHLRNAVGDLETVGYCQRADACAEKGTRPACIFIADAQRSVQTLQPVTRSGEYALPATSRADGVNSGLRLTVPLVAHNKALGAMTLISSNKSCISKGQKAILASIGQQVGVAVENARLYREADQWAKGMSRLHEISLELNAILDPDEICRLITMQAATLLNCSSAGLFRIIEEEDEVVGVASYRMADGGVDGLRLPLSTSLMIKHTIEFGEPVPIEDVRSDPRISPGLWEHYPMRALLLVPVGGTGDLQGILVLVEAARTRYWEPSEIKLLQNFANRAAVAWENANLQKQIEWAAALEERQRIAADMHDGLAQTISMLALRNDQAAQLVEQDARGPALDELADIQEIISLAAGDLRRSIASLRESPRPPNSLQEELGALTWHDADGRLREILFMSDIETAVHLPPEELDQILCIVKEALLNASRHAAAEEITIRLGQQDNTLSLSVEDNGQGFDMDALDGQDGNHFGLSIMHARAQRVGGQLTVQSAVGRGTTVLLDWQKPDSMLPYQHKAAAFLAAEKIQLQ
jgi:signal transduction histidine kinase